LKKLESGASVYAGQQYSHDREPNCRLIRNLVSLIRAPTFGTLICKKETLNL